MRGPRQKMVHLCSVLLHWHKWLRLFRHHDLNQDHRSHHILVENQNHQHREHLPCFLWQKWNDWSLNIWNDGAKVNSSSAQRDGLMRYVVQKLLMLASKLWAVWKFFTSSGKPLGENIASDCNNGRFFSKRFLIELMTCKQQHGRFLVSTMQGVFPLVHLWQSHHPLLFDVLPLVLSNQQFHSHCQKFELPYLWGNSH